MAENGKGSKPIGNFENVAEAPGEAFVELLELDDDDFAENLGVMLENLTQAESNCAAAFAKYKQALQAVNHLLNDMNTRLEALNTDDPFAPSVSGWPGFTPEITIDEELKQAQTEWNEAKLAVTTARKSLLDALLEKDGLNEFGRAAFIQALYHAKLQERAGYGRDFKLGLEKLNEQLFEDQIVYVHDSETMGFYRVGQPAGITVTIANNSTTPYVIVRTHVAKGSEIKREHLGVALNVKDLPADRQSLQLYGLNSQNPLGAQVIDLLKSDVAQGTREEGCQFLVGRAALDALDAEERDSAQVTALAVAAYQQNFPVGLINFLDRHIFKAPGSNEKFLEILIAAIAEALMETKTIQNREPAQSQISPDHSVDTLFPLQLNLKSADNEIMRILADLCDIDRDAGCRLVEEYINKTETEWLQKPNRNQARQDELRRARHCLARPYDPPISLIFLAR